MLLQSRNTPILIPSPYSSAGIQLLGIAAQTYLVGTTTAWQQSYINQCQVSSIPARGTIKLRLVIPASQFSKNTASPRHSLIAGIQRWEARARACGRATLSVLVFEMAVMLFLGGFNQLWMGEMIASHVYVPVDHRFWIRI
jgi:hypothetical protein